MTAISLLAGLPRAVGKLGKFCHGGGNKKLPGKSAIMATTVEVLAAAFKDAGTPFIVGHPGGESVELMEAARQRQMGFLLMKQEAGGAVRAAPWGGGAGHPPP